MREDGDRDPRSSSCDSGAHRPSSEWAAEIRLVVTILVLVLISACTPRPAVKSGVPDPVPAEAEEAGWWFVHFRHRWPEGAAPDWYRDALIADQVVAPVLEAHHADIDLWRIHRRATRDHAGHAFSFIFYASPVTAKQVNAAIAENPVLKRLLEKGVIEHVAYDDTSRVTRPGVGDTSDPKWSLAIRNSWPHFVMGASRMWMDLVRSQAQDPAVANKGLDARYSDVEQRINALWQREGRHALLHHLNAIYGYEPLLIWF